VVHCMQSEFRFEEGEQQRLFNVVVMMQHSEL
jgi:hypothetical protein